ncbi:MAG: carboxypeptidase-like regulatory domain-containing protein, partial [Acidobacteriota bacterium]
MSSTLLKLTRMFAFAIVLSTIMLCVQAVSAQETRGTIRGTVTDPNGGAVPNASVQVIDPTRGNTVKLTTNSDGFYQANYLVPGTYQIAVEAPGFKKTLRDNVLLQIGSSIQVDVPLEVGGAQETVNVTADIPQLNTENASLGQVVDQQRINELPTPHGDPYALIGLSNGVAFTGDPRLDRPFEPTHIVGYAINGVRGNRMDLTIDGVAATATADANQITASYVPPSDVIQEFKVQTATFDAQFGNTEGAVTSILIKSGANKIHGSAYLSTEPVRFAANDSFGKGRGQAKPQSYSYRDGGYISGPIRKDKTFFLFGIETIKDARPRFDVTNNGATTQIPTAALASGDFSQYMCAAGVNSTTSCTNIFNPYTLTSGSSGTATQFSDVSRATASNPTGLNIIPANLISPVAKAFLTFMGSPKNPGLAGNINDSTLLETTSPYYNYTFRVDHQVSQNNHMFVRGSWYNRVGLYNRYTDSAYDGQAFAFYSRGGVIDDVHIFNSTTFLNVKYGYNRFVRYQQSQNDAVGFDLTKLWGATQGGLYNGIVPTAIR